MPTYEYCKSMRRFLTNPDLGSERYKVASHYLGARLFPEYEDRRHLDETMLWLCRAQDARGGRGVSAVYYLLNGWAVEYPETSGYIIATYLAYADLSGNDEFVRRAVAIGDWEIEIQHPGGGVLSSPEVDYTRVFNTGQVVLGWCALYEKTGEGKYLDAAKRAADFLVDEQEQDGTWVRNTYCGPRTYHARVDWALLRVAGLTGEERYITAALRNLRWVLDQQHENGWFSQCGFNNDLPIMHVIVYTLRGLLECHLTGIEPVSRLGIIDAVRKAADALLESIKRNPVRGIEGMVPTSFDEHWNSPDSHSCLTGNAQFSCFLFRLSQATGEQGYRLAAERIMSATKRTQALDISFSPIRGAIAGTFPLYSGYLANSYPNWAAKFFADALMMKLCFNNGLTIPA